MNKNLLFSIFSIHNQPFASLVLKMMNYKKNEETDIFSFIEEKSKNQNQKKIRSKKIPNKTEINIMYLPKQILIPLKDFIFPVKKDLGKFLKPTEEFKKAQEEIIKNVCITSITDSYDCVTFSEELFLDVDRILELFLIISEQKLFTLSDSNMLLTQEYKSLPLWFKKRGFNSIACWIVAHFEIRIVHLLVKKLL